MVVVVPVVVLVVLVVVVLVLVVSFSCSCSCSCWWRCWCWCWCLTSSGPGNVGNAHQIVGALEAGWAAASRFIVVSHSRFEVTLPECWERGDVVDSDPFPVTQAKIQLLCSKYFYAWVSTVTLQYALGCLGPGFNVCTNCYRTGVVGSFGERCSPRSWMTQRVFVDIVTSPSVKMADIILIL